MCLSHKWWCLLYTLIYLWSQVQKSFGRVQDASIALNCDIWASQEFAMFPNFYEMLCHFWSWRELTGMIILRNTWQRKLPSKEQTFLENWVCDKRYSQAQFVVGLDGYRLSRPHCRFVCLLRPSFRWRREGGRADDFFQGEIICIIRGRAALRLIS